MKEDLYLKRQEGALTADDVPADILPEAQVLVCPEHPEARWVAGFGYAGGGFGGYKVCVECDRIFAKRKVSNA